jgi:hypothetical protein
MRESNVRVQTALDQYLSSGRNNVCHNIPTTDTRKSNSVPSSTTLCERDLPKTPLTMSRLTVRVGVLSLQGGFVEHISLLEQAAAHLKASNTSPSTSTSPPSFSFLQVRTPEQLALCDALIIPGGESTTISLVAAQSGLLEPLRDFVKCVVFCPCFSLSPFSIHLWLLIYYYVR